MEEKLRGGWLPEERELSHFFSYPHNHREGWWVFVTVIRNNVELKLHYVDSGGGVHLVG